MPRRRDDRLGESTASSVIFMSASPTTDQPPGRLTMTHDDETPVPEPNLDSATAEALDWFMRRQSGAMTAAEAATFETWLTGHPANARAYDRVAGLWNAPELGHALETARTSATAGTPASGRPGRARSGLRAAMALAAMLVLAMGLGRIADIDPFAPSADLTTETGEQSDFTLADGSVVRLNADSAVNVAFGPGTRRIELLRGEAFFDVMPDTGRPFEVAAGRSLTRVVGTAFSVLLRKDETEVRVKRGHVQVSGDDGGAPVDLTPGQGVTVAAGHAGHLAPLEPQAAFAWLDGRFVFRDRPLSEVMDRLARHHRGKVVLTTDRLRNLRVSGNYRLDDPDNVVAALADIAGADMVRLPGLLTILH